MVEEEGPVVFCPGSFYCEFVEGRVRVPVWVVLDSFCNCFVLLDEGFVECVFCFFEGFAVFGFDGFHFLFFGFLDAVEVEFGFGVAFHCFFDEGGVDGHGRFLSGLGFRYSMDYSTCFYLVQGVSVNQ